MMSMFILFIRKKNDNLSYLNDVTTEIPMIILSNPNEIIDK